MSSPVRLGVDFGTSHTVAALRPHRRLQSDRDRTVGLLAESILYEEPTLSPFVVLAALPMIPVLVLPHRRAARDWFGALNNPS